MANRRGEELRDVCERVLLSFWAFSHGKMSGSVQKEPAYDDDSTGDEYDQDKELSIDIPPESPLSSSKKPKKRKAKDGGGSRDKKPKRSKSKSAAKGDKVAEISYEDGSEGEDEPPDDVDTAEEAASSFAKPKKSKKSKCQRRRVEVMLYQTALTLPTPQLRSVARQLVRRQRMLNMVRMLPHRSPKTRRNGREEIEILG